MSDYAIPFQFRAYADIAYRRPKRERQRLAMSGRPRLTMDWETTDDATMRGRYGSGRLSIDEWDGRDVTGRLIEKVAFFADDLEDFRPLTYERLEILSSKHRMRLISESDFKRGYFLRCGQPNVLSPNYKVGTLVFFNASFDIFRFATRITQPQGEMFRNGVGCGVLNDPHEPRYRESRAGIGMRRELTKGKAGTKTWIPPVILDTAQLVRGLTGKPHTLKSAGKAFRCDVLKSESPDVFDPEGHPERYRNRRELIEAIDYEIEYHFRDVEATDDLYEKSVSRFYRHPIDLPPEKVYSAASIDKAYQRAMGIHAPLCACEDCRPACTCYEPCKTCINCKGKPKSKPKCLCQICAQHKIKCAIHHYHKERLGAWDVPKDILGIFDAAFMGGKSDCRIRLTAVPAWLFDGKSMYPMQMINQGMWELRTARKLEVRQETEAVQQFLDTVTLNDLFKPETWPLMRGVCEFRANGELISGKYDYGRGDNSRPHIATKHVYQEPSDPSLSRTILDIVAGKILSGKVPQILRAYRVYGVGRQKGLRKIRFAGRTEFDPVTDNWNRFLVNQREALKRDGDPYDEELGYKTTGNSDYGITAERNLKPRPATVHGLNHESWNVREAEEPGEFNCPLFACLITGGARLILAMIEALAGPGVMMDTDSYAIPCTPDGIPVNGVPTLSYEKVWEIARRFDSLNPYDRELVPHWLDRQMPEPGDDDPVYFAAISAKRYSAARLVNGKPVVTQTGDDEYEISETRDLEPSTLEILKHSEHGLGLYMSPYSQAAQDETEEESRQRQKRFYKEAWEWIWRVYVLQEPDVPDPAWFDMPVVAKLPVRTRHTWKTFQALNRGPGGYTDNDLGNLKPIHEQVGVPGSFYLTVFRSRSNSLDDAYTDRERLQLIAPFSTSGNRLEYPWFDLHGGKRYQITVDPEDARPGVVLVKTYREVLREYAEHPEEKYDGPDGLQCDADTRGILQPGNVRPSAYQHVTKDASSLVTLADKLTFKGPHRYRDDKRERLNHQIREMLKLKGIGRRQLEHNARITEWPARNFISGKAEAMRRRNLLAIHGFAIRLAVQDLQSTGNLPDGLRGTDCIGEWVKLVAAGVMSPPAYKHEIYIPPGVRFSAEDIPAGTYTQDEGFYE